MRQREKNPFRDALVSLGSQRLLLGITRPVLPLQIVIIPFKYVMETITTEAASSGSQRNHPSPQLNTAVLMPRSCYSFKDFEKRCLAGVFLGITETI